MASNINCGPYERHTGDHHLETTVAEYKRGEHIRLLEKWCGDLLDGSTILKTDSYEEAFGQDSFVDWLSHNSKFVLCIDVSRDVIGRAKSRAPQLKLVNASAVRTPFRDSTFDVIVSNSTLDHLPPGDLLPAMKELSRVTRRGGLLVLTLDNAHNPLYRLGYSINKKIGGLPYNQEKCYLKGEVTPLIAEAGFEVEEVVSIVHLPTPFNLIAKFVSPASRLMYNLPIKAGIAFFSIFGFGGWNIHTGWFLAMKCVKR